MDCYMNLAIVPYTPPKTAMEVVKQEAERYLSRESSPENPRISTIENLNNRPPQLQELSLSNSRISWIDDLEDDVVPDLVEDDVMPDLVEIPSLEDIIERITTMVSIREFFLQIQNGNHQYGQFFDPEKGGPAPAA